MPVDREEKMPKAQALGHSKLKTKKNHSKDLERVATEFCEWKEYKRQRKSKSETERAGPGNQAKNHIIEAEGVIHFGKSVDSDVKVVLSDINKKSFWGLRAHERISGGGVVKVWLWWANKKGIIDGEFNNHLKSFAKREQIIEG